MILNFPQKQLELECELDVENLKQTILGFIDLPNHVQIIILQSNSIKFQYKYVGSDDIFGFNSISSMTVGSPNNLNSNAFNLLRLKISQGFEVTQTHQGIMQYYEYIMCSNNQYLLNGTCSNDCPLDYIVDNVRMECVRPCHPSCSICSLSDPTYCLRCALPRISPPDCNCPTGQYNFEDFCAYVNNYICNEGFFLDQNNVCQVCDSNCLTCIGSRKYCLSCSPILILVGNQCMCQTNQYFDTFGVCQDCSSNCATCENSSNNCTSCNLQKQLTLSNGQCMCKINEYVDSNKVCQPCFQLCYRCISGLPNACLDCIQLRILDEVTRSCNCVDGTYEDQNSDCKICNKTCKTCSSDQLCLTCAENRSIQNQQCVCNDGYFQDQFQTCQICKPPCRTCLSELYCLSCINSQFMLIQNSCEIISAQLCGNGQIDDKEKCDDGNNLPNDGCFQCQVQNQWYCDKSEPSKCEQAPFMVLSYLNQTYPLQYIEISFSQQIQIQSIKKLSATISYQIQNLAQDAYEINNNVIQDATQELSFASYVLEVQINQLMTEYPILQVDLNQRVVNYQTIDISNSSLTIQLQMPIYVSYTQKKTASTIGTVNQKVNYGLLGISFISLIMGSSDLMSEILDILQYQSYLKFVNFNYPKNLQMYFSISDMLSIAPVLEFLHLDKFFTSRKHQQQAIISNGKFSYYKMDADLISGLNCQFLQITGLLLIFIFLQVFQKITKTEICISKYIAFLNYMDSKGFYSISKASYRLIKNISKLSSIYTWEGMEYFLIINNWDLLFKVFLFFKKKSFSTVREYISTILGTIILLLYVNILLQSFHKRNVIGIQKQKLNKIYFEALTLCRTWFFMIFLIVFQDNQIIQTILIVLNSFQYLLFIRYSGLLPKYQVIVFQISELVILLFTLSSFAYFDDWKQIITQEIQQYIAMSQIFLLTLALVAKITKQIYNYIQLFFDLIKNRLKNKQNLPTSVVQPNTLLAVQIRRPLVTRRFF